MRIELFTVDEANRVAGEIRPRLERLVMKKREFDRLERRMEILLVATSGAAHDNPDSLELRSLEEKRRRLGEGPRSRTGGLLLAHGRSAGVPVLAGERARGVALALARGRLLWPAADQGSRAGVR